MSSFIMICDVKGYVEVHYSLTLDSESCSKVPSSVPSVRSRRGNILTPVTSSPSESIWFQRVEQLPCLSESETRLLTEV